MLLVLNSVLRGPGVTHVDAERNGLGFGPPTIWHEPLEGWVEIDTVSIS
jgi:hypothetical protein